MVLHIIRTIFLLVVLAIAVSYVGVTEQTAMHSTGQSYITWYILVPTVLALLLVVVDTFWHQKRLQALSGLFFGVIAGLALAYMVSLIVELVASLLLPAAASPPGPEPKLTVSSFAGSSSRPVTDSQPAAESRPANASTLTAAQQAELANEVHDFNKRYQEWLGKKAEYDDYSLQVKTVQMIKLLLGAAVVFMCVSFVIQTKDDFRFVIPYVEFSKQTKGARPLLLDTSVIIDGRVADIAETKFLESEVIVPRFVLAELQSIADSDDKLKRNRGRRGLDVLNKLQGSKSIEIRIMDVHVATVDEAADVDMKLVALAEHLDGRVVTNDYNLNKVAQLRGVTVININDLANALKPIVLPGETMTVKIIKPGEEMGQGVGYLEDGTMVVVEQGRDCIGKEIVITVTSALQTSAGRMIFGRLDPDRSFGRRQPGVANHAPAAAGPTPSAGHGTGAAAPPPAQAVRTPDRPAPGPHAPRQNPPPPAPPKA